MQVTLSGSLSGAGCSAPAAAPMRTVLLPPVSALPNVLPNQRLPLSASSQGSCGCGKNGLKHCVAATAGWQWEGMSNSSSSNSSSRTRVVAASSSRASALRFEADEDSHTDTQQQLEAGLQQIIRDNRPEALGQNGLGASSNGDTQGNAGPAASGGNSTAHLQAAAAAASSTAPQEPKYKTVMLKVGLRLCVWKRGVAGTERFEDPKQSRGTDDKLTVGISAATSVRQALPNLFLECCGPEPGFGLSHVRRARTVALP
eukprot:scaffold52082_cov17-Tisochrysis_lutea.AAC.1